MTWSLDAAIDAFDPQFPLGVAYSGGVDSTALLHACVRRWPSQVVALHVNHNVQAAAAQFERHCQVQTQSLGVPLVVASVQAGATSGQSPEDAARVARYRALQNMATTGAHPVKTIALAQHADDQVETMLMALCRGAGVSGLRAMASSWQHDDVTYVRPLLRVARSDIEAWLVRQGGAFIEDPTNEDTSFTRNALRAAVMPSLAQIYPQFRDTMARSAMHMGQAQALLDEVAQADLEAACQGGGGGGPLIHRLQNLSAARLSNVLRHWLKVHYSVIPSHAQLSELTRVLRACTTRGHQIHLKVGHGFVQRRGRELAWYNPSVLRTEN